MQWRSGGRAIKGPPRRGSRPGLLLAAACALALTLTACDPQDNPNALAGQPRGASVAFESIDGPPPGQFNQLVQDLNNEAQARRLAVMSRESPAAYRVRGYLAAKVVGKRETTISWVWDVFDGDDHRALRIEGEQTVKSVHNGWAAADDAMMNRIARNSTDQLAAFLTSSDVAPGTPDNEPQTVAFGVPGSSPEAAGIYRIFRPDADPEAVGTAEPTSAVPMPPRRPPTAPTVVSARETLMLAASSY
jgi:hypothetical protein